ncbi:hypothetical protein PQX77_020164 [Marasmius sp. AFHP31]|nr:hypothetical protein PQX77_020164 [Marasmius sp. AFHP31]
MSNGDVISYFETRGGGLDDRVKMIHQTSQGIQYLHEHHPPIIHSDLKGANILVSDDGQCCVTDFGLATIETESLKARIHSSASQAVARGSLPWLAPELMNPDHIDVSNRRSRDIYALGCTIYEILAGKTPFCEKRMDVQIIMAVLTGSRPTRPDICPDWLWTIIESCWRSEPSRRPNAMEVANILGENRTGTLQSVGITSDSSSPVAITLNVKVKPIGPRPKDDLHSSSETTEAPQPARTWSLPPAPDPLHETLHEWRAEDADDFLIHSPLGDDGWSSQPPLVARTLRAPIRAPAAARRSALPYTAVLPNTCFRCGIANPSSWKRSIQRSGKFVSDIC